MLAPPRFVFLEVTSTCNLRCGHCHLWTTREPPDALRTEEKVRVIEALASFSPRAVVVLTGGETMSKHDEFFALTSACRRVGLSSAANTNGTLVRAGDVDRLLREGPRHLVVSLDSHRPEVFDRTRGVPGTFDTVTSLLRALVARRSALGGSDVQLMTSTILFDENLRELEATVEFLLGLGVDRLLFQPLSRTFGLARARDVFFERHLPRDFAVVDAAIDRLVALRRAGVPIETTVNDLEWMKLYFRNPDFIGEQVCGSGERNVMIDQCGRVQLCFRMLDLTGGRFLGNVRDDSLQRLWTGNFATSVREVMAACRQNCGMLNCHRRMEAR
jgi:MoaA/NifB/PqqE/SkfB family radical SAM enzyme